MAHVEHISDLTGHYIPSVSQIPGIFSQDISGFEDWICKRLHEKEEKCCIRAKRDFYSESADLGNDIHGLMEAYLRGEEFSEGVPEYQAAVFDPIAQFFKDSDYKPLYIEHQMTGEEMGGTLDTAGTFGQPFWKEQRKTFWANTEIGDGLPDSTDTWVVDLKIKSKLDRLHPLQLYGYSLLMKEKHGIEAVWGLIIRREKKLNKTPQIQLKAYYLPAYKPQWDASMLMYKFLND